MMGNQQAIEIGAEQDTEKLDIKKRRVSMQSNSSGENDTDLETESDAEDLESADELCIKHERFDEWYQENICKTCSFDPSSMEHILKSQNSVFPFFPENLTTCDSCGDPFSTEHYFRNAASYSSNTQGEFKWLFWPKECIVEHCVRCLAYQTYFGASTGFQNYTSRCENCFEADDQIQYVTKANTCRDLNSGDMVRSKRDDSNLWEIAYVTAFSRDPHHIFITFEDDPSTKYAVLRHYSEVQRCMQKDYQDPIGLPRTFEALIPFLVSRGSQIDLSEIMIVENVVPVSTNMELNHIMEQIPGKITSRDRRVESIIHPSWYCYVRGFSPLVTTDSALTESACRHWSNLIYPPITPSRPQFQWLPTNFNINNQGRVHIEPQDYINGLPPKHERPDMYNVFEDLFSHFVPMLHDLAKVKSDPKYCVTGKRLQVITKAVDFVLSPSQQLMEVWHQDGIASEHIMAVGYYYAYKSKFLRDEGLGFRRNVTEEEHEMALYSNSLQDCELNVELGVVKTPEGRLVLFSNDQQHKRILLENQSTTRVATARLICFYIVDPRHRILSTSEVPDQRPARVRIELDVLLNLCMRRGGFGRQGVQLPPELLNIILDFAGGGVDAEEARSRRSKLLYERKQHCSEVTTYMERRLNFISAEESHEDVTFV